MLGSKGAVRAAARVVVVVALLVGGLAGSRADAQELPTDPGDLLDLLLQLIGEAAPDDLPDPIDVLRSEEHTSELQSLMRISYAVFRFKKKNNNITIDTNHILD